MFPVYKAGFLTIRRPSVVDSPRFAARVREVQAIVSSTCVIKIYLLIGLNGLEPILETTFNLNQKPRISLSLLIQHCVLTPLSLLSASQLKDGYSFLGYSKLSIVVGNYSFSYFDYGSIGPANTQLFLFLPVESISSPYVLLQFISYASQQPPISFLFRK